jgi:uncharacterized protein YbaA (DUF1428 family)
LTLACRCLFSFKWAAGFLPLLIQVYNDTNSLRRISSWHTSMVLWSRFNAPSSRRIKDMSRKCGAIWREFGALEFRECVGDDVKPGKLTSFPQSVMLEEGEVVVFSWIVYESRAKRDEVNDKVMKDPRMADFMKPENMPFDGKRMIYGGFEMLVDL